MHGLGVGLWGLGVWAIGGQVDRGQGEIFDEIVYQKNL